LSRPSVEEAVAELRAEYLRSLPARLASLGEALAGARAGDAAALRRATVEAHRIRGTAGSIGLAALGVEAGRVEDAADQLAAGAAPGPAWAEIDAAMAAMVTGPA
jgi:HPt (histidine-containing phosphotransfer) domain-containing protein